ncbi:protealysin inhibitor emfourin [Cellulophaga sp. L1A9]|uniref:protealysin inhibitor emfourin n=1 Tax=Cellulophaga sp. L1A9 TaxID=2686362 RepID=UPI00131DF8B7|nr:protealysin inhibitor emfourin [Cellulophaga sp. L1A9]
MKYSLSISGGITGIPKKYAGEVRLADAEQKKILETLKVSSIPKNKNLRDGLQYHLQLEENTQNYEANFDDSNLPPTIRNLISTILNQN